MRPAPGRLANYSEIAIAIGVVVLIIYLPAIREDGHSGMQAVWLAQRWQDEVGTWERGSLLQKLARASLLGIPFLATLFSSQDVLLLLLWGIVGFSILPVPFTRDKRSLSCMLIGALLVEVRAQPLPGRLTSSEANQVRHLDSTASSITHPLTRYMSSLILVSD